ncbi:MAG: hypothetical protein AAGN66_16185 [Acidobacteriota bacterium]
MRCSLTFVLSLLLALLAAPAAAQQCHDRALAAFASAFAEGQATPASKLCMARSLASPPPGSGNIPILNVGALWLTGDIKDEVLLPWLSGTGGWSHNGKEDGSIIYEPWNLAVALAVTHRACQRQRSPQLCTAGRLYLRATWAKYALSATPKAPARIRWGVGGKWFERPRINYIRYEGPFVHYPGDRQVTTPKGNSTAAWSDVHRINAALAWAADWPARRHGSAITRQPATLVIWTASQLAGGRSYGQSTPAGLWGLTNTERSQLRAFLGAPTDHTKARPVAAWLEPYPRRKGIELRVRRYWQDARVLAVRNHTQNANKPGAVAVTGTARESTWVAPSTYKGVGAATAHAVIEDGASRVRTWSNDGNEMLLPIGKWGGLAWEVVWDDRGVRFTYPAPEPGTTKPATPSGPPATPPATPPTGGSPDPRYNQAILLLARIIADTPESAEHRQLLEIAGAVVRRIESLSQAPADPTRRAAVEQAARVLAEKARE